MKKLLFISTGGTIACEPTEKGLAPALSPSVLLEYVPKIAGRCEITAVQPFCLDSTDMSPREWKKLAALIRAEYGGYDGFVITHGTDTMSYTAAGLSCLIQNSAKPIVLTGSQLPMKAEGSDARGNLLGAFLYALDERAWGVRVAFCGRIIDGRSVIKLHTRELDAFRSAVDYEPAKFRCENGGELCVNDKPYSGETRFYERLDEWVAVVKLIPGMPYNLLGVRGVGALIVESFGTGGIPDDGYGHYQMVLERLMRSGVQVIIATQARFGGTELSRYEVGSRLSGALETGSMTTEFAAVKAMWALAYAQRDREEFKRLFTAEI